jgi:hypothetical protein
LNTAVQALAVSVGPFVRSYCLVEKSSNPTSLEQKWIYLLQSYWRPCTNVGLNNDYLFDNDFDVQVHNFPNLLNPVKFPWTEETIETAPYEDAFGFLQEHFMTKFDHGKGSLLAPLFKLKVKRYLHCHVCKSSPVPTLIPVKFQSLSIILNKPEDTDGLPREPSTEVNKMYLDDTCPSPSSPQKAETRKNKRRKLSKTSTKKRPPPRKYLIRQEGA